MTLFTLPSVSSSSISFTSHSHSSSNKHFRLRFNSRRDITCQYAEQPRKKAEAIVIGAGLAGLAAAARLHSDKIPFVLFEASDGVGGRVRTDVVDGFLLDRGFQIFITAYPEARKLLDYQELELQRFYSGSRIYFDGQFHTVADPVRHFLDSIASLWNPIGSVLDKLLIGSTRIILLDKSDDEILLGDEVTTINKLRQIGFSTSIIERFFIPFFGGIFFDRQLQTSSRLFDFIFKCLALGDNTLPAKGIAAIPDQIAKRFPPDSIFLNTRVDSIDFDKSEKHMPIVRLENGDALQSEVGVILAVEEPEVEKILSGKDIKPVRKKPDRSTVCLYFSSHPDKIPVQDPVLFLNGSGKGIVNNMFFATNVAPTYGPPGKALVSVSLVGLFEDTTDEDLTAQVVEELSEWFGRSVVRSWKHLRTYRVGFAQPNQCPPTNIMKNPRVRPGLYLCGDYLTSATFDGALVSGRKAVEALLKDRAAFVEV